MTESKIELTERLRREGGWAEASKFKDTALKEFRSKGMKKAEAAEAAWEAMADAFPPCPPTEPPPTDDDPGRCVSGCLTGSSTIPDTWGEIPDSAPLEAEVDWVHQNRVLVVEDRPSGSPRLHWERARRPAPSFGAVNLMEFAATNRKGFMDILQRVKPATDDGDEERIQKQERMRIADMRGVLEGLHKKWEEDLLADVPGTVREGVRSQLADWTRRFGLSLPEGASTSLEAHIASLVQDSAKAISCTSGAG